MVKSMNGGPKAAYEARIASGELRADSAQLGAVTAFEALHGALSVDRSGRGFLGGLFKGKAETGPKGLYLWGGVGRGKSMLMDIFFETAPVEKKRRVHFHAFMQEIHDALRTARAEGLTDPMKVVADRVADQVQLLCFDELQITDITDAMMVGRLFERLFEGGVVVVTTSNRVPDDLYKDGLNRKLFLPFIDLINERLDVMELVSDTDHRQAALKSERLYFSPLGADADAGVAALWERLAGGSGAPLELKNKGRSVVIPEVLNGAGRGVFSDFCEVPFGPSDFLLIAEAVSVLFVENVPVLSRSKANEAKRFVTLVDALYEAETRLICSAAAVPDALYEEGAGAFEFERTASRLIEMGSGSWP